MNVYTRADETEGPTGGIAPQRPEDSTMGLPELGAMEREYRALRGLGPALEIGVYHGRTTVILGQVGPVVAVDWLKGNLELALPERRGNTGWSRQYQLDHLLPNLAGLGPLRDRVLLLEGRSDAVLREIHAKAIYDLLLREVGSPGGDHAGILEDAFASGFSVIVLDGDKSTAGLDSDLTLAWPLLAKGGTLFVDDFYYSTVDEPDPGTTERAMRSFSDRNGLDWSVDLVGTQPGGTVPKMARVRTAAQSVGAEPAVTPKAGAAEGPGPG